MTSYQFNRLSSAYNASCANPLVRSYTNITNTGMEPDIVTVYDLWTTEIESGWSYRYIKLGDFPYSYSAQTGINSSGNCYSALINGAFGTWGNTRKLLNGVISTRVSETLVGYTCGNYRSNNIFLYLIDTGLYIYFGESYCTAHLTITAPLTFFVPATSLAQISASAPASGTKLYPSSTVTSL